MDQPHHSLLSLPILSKPRRRLIHVDLATVNKKLRTSPDGVHLRELTIGQAGLGCACWDGAIVLARWITSHASAVRGLVGMEVGAGVGLPGIVAARYAHRLVLSDYMSEVVHNLAYNITLNSNVSLDTEDDDERDQVELDRRRALRQNVKDSARVAILDWHAINPDEEDKRRMKENEEEDRERKKGGEDKEMLGLETTPLILNTGNIDEAESSSPSSSSIPSPTLTSANSTPAAARSHPALPSLSTRLSSLSFVPSPLFIDPTGLGPASCDFLLGAELIYVCNPHHQQCFQRILEYYLKDGGCYYCVQSRNREGMPAFLQQITAPMPPSIAAPSASASSPTSSAPIHVPRFRAYWQEVDPVHSGLTGLYRSEKQPKGFVQREETYVFYVIQKLASSGVEEETPQLDLDALSIPGGKLVDVRNQPAPEVAMLRDEKEARQEAMTIMFKH